MSISLRAIETISRIIDIIITIIIIIIIIIIKTLFTLGLEHKIYRNEMITGRGKKVTQASHSRASGLQARLLETSSPKNAKARAENAENSLIFYCEFKTVLTSPS